MATAVTMAIAAVLRPPRILRRPFQPRRSPRSKPGWPRCAAEALTRGIRQEIVDAALADIQPVEQILDRDRTQAEFALDLTSYLKRRLTRTTLRSAQQMHAAHRDLLESVGKKYGVQPRVITAVWGLESNFGRFAGVRPTIPALATLAYDQRRASAVSRPSCSARWRSSIAATSSWRNLKGSWAGALGQPQFMPSTYLKFSQDFDGDGRRDIWTSLADVFASVAFYLREHGWSDTSTWGREVAVPKASRAAILELPRREDGCRAERALTEPLPLEGAGGSWASRRLATDRCRAARSTPRWSPTARASSSSTRTTRPSSPTTVRPATRSASPMLSDRLK